MEVTDIYFVDFGFEETILVSEGRKKTCFYLVTKELEKNKAKFCKGNRFQVVQKPSKKPSKASALQKQQYSLNFAVQKGCATSVNTKFRKIANQSPHQQAKEATVVSC